MSAPPLPDSAEYDPVEEAQSRLPVTDARAWMWLIGLGLVLLGGLLWLALGQAPQTVSGNGMIVPTRGFVEVGTAATGTVAEILVDPGQSVEKGDVVARLVDEAGGPIVVVSPTRGEVATVLVRQGATTDLGAPLLTIDPTDDGNVATAYLPAAQGSAVKPGMRAAVAVASVPQSEFGAIQGTVSEVATLPATAERIKLVVGGNEQLPGFFLADGPVVEVTVALDTDPATPSGYRWTFGYGPDQPLTTGTLARVTVTLRDNTILGRLAP